MANFDHEDFGEDLALVNFSSGTTGFPKAIPSTQKSLWNRVKPNLEGNMYVFILSIKYDN
jgi:acyl-coenzyme A synthetase/AMP-(fatty) acid ligase